MSSIFDKYLDATDRIDPIKCVGHVSRVHGLLIESRGPQATIGEICRIELGEEIGERQIEAEVVGLKDDIVQLMAYNETTGIKIGCRVIASGTQLEVAVSGKLLGRILDYMGRPMDGKGDIESIIRYPAMAAPPAPNKRPTIKERISTGVRAIDGLLAVGRGQRLGIFAGAGVGKSTLLGMIARNTSADVNVVALIGERGKEVNEFLEYDLGKEGLARSVVIVSPGDAPPLARLKGAHVATAVAEYFRDQGLDVMLLFDSVTRFARAMREKGIAAGEPPATRGFPPSMFDSMQKLLERSGTSEKGTITGFYTVLVEGGDMDEPVADTVKAIIDGHAVLSGALAERYHYPAIDVLRSVSRNAHTVSGPETKKAVGVMRRLLADYSVNEDFINAGVYKQGTNPGIDKAIEKHMDIEQFLIQEVDERSSISETLSAMGKIAGVKIPEDEMGEYHPRKFILQNQENEVFDDSLPASETPDRAEFEESGQDAGAESAGMEEIAANPETEEQPGPLPLMNF